MSQRSLERGREELRAGQALLEAGFPSQAVSRAYLAAFHAACATLTTLGETPATRTGVLSAFARHVVGEDGIDHETGRILRRLFENRNDVDYALAEAPPGEARSALEEAQTLLDASADWIERRSA